VFVSYSILCRETASVSYSLNRLPRQAYSKWIYQSKHSVVHLLMIFTITFIILRQLIRS